MGNKIKIIKIKLVSKILKIMGNCLNSKNQTIVGDKHKKKSLVSKQK